MINQITECYLPENLIAPSAQQVISKLEEKGYDHFEIAKLMAEETVVTAVSVHSTKTTKDKIFLAILNELSNVLCDGSDEHKKFRSSINGNLNETIAALAGFIAHKLGVENAIILPVIVVIIKGLRNISKNLTCDILKEQITRYSKI